VRVSPSSDRTPIQSRSCGPLPSPDGSGDRMPRSVSSAGSMSQEARRAGVTAAATASFAVRPMKCRRFRYTLYGVISEERMSQGRRISIAFPGQLYPEGFRYSKRR
jgi:hypothetical protein